MDLYEYIHKFFNKQERFNFPYNIELIENFTCKNGLYVLFEKGELFNEYDRIVRIGSHDGNNCLVKRLKDHFLANKQRNSIFRKHLGRCLLNKEQDPYLCAWNKPFKKIKDKEKYKDIVDLEYEKKYENLISNYIRQNLSFCLIPKIYNKQERDKIEEGLVAILSQSTLKKSSDNWLGNWHPDCRIRESKIWNLEYLNGDKLNLEEFKKLIESRYCLSSI
ncbi:MAG: hypothetical protein HXY50_17005 [Ignavibacteriaceae bacterium]|nr:hypothetical protein [Ignavibacteriaceae bacterium]